MSITWLGCLRMALLGVAVSSIVGCAQLTELEQALGPKTADQPTTIRYTVPTLTLARGSGTVQNRGGVEVRADLVPVGSPHLAYRATITSDQQLFAIHSNPPQSSPDPVWDGFYRTVYRFPDSEPVSQADTRSFSGYQVLMVPVVETLPARLTFKLTLTNHTARILKIDLSPQVVLDGKVWDETYAHRVEDSNNGLRYLENLPPLPSVLSTLLTLEPGKSQTWQYEGPWTEDAFPAGDNSGGTVVLAVQDILVDPVNLRKESFRFVYDYTTRQFSREGVQKSSTMLLRPSIAEQLNGQIFQ